MNFETCCEILKLTKHDLGIDPSLIDQCTADRLEKDILFFIRHNYKKQALKLHPDKDASKVEDFKILSEAYQTAESIVNEIIEKKRNTNSAPNKDNIPIQNRPNIKEMPFEELLKYISQVCPDFSKTFWDSLDIEEKEFEKKTQILNVRLEEECTREEEKIIQKAFETYLNHSDRYYKEYQNNEYSKYLNKFNVKKTNTKNAIRKQYQPAINKANTLMNIGLVFFFLILPLILSLVQWNTKRKLIQERDRKLAKAEQEISQPKSVWKLKPENCKSQEEWSQEGRYKTLTEFKKNIKDTTEGLEAGKLVRGLYDNLTSRTLSNNRIANYVIGRQMSPNSGEDCLYYSLFDDGKASKDDKTMDANLHPPNPEQEKPPSLSM